jgi:hypothetical protein
MTRSSRFWLSLHLGLGLAWIALVWSRRHRAPGVRDAGGRGLADLVGLGLLAGEAPPLVFLNRE